MKKKYFLLFILFFNYCIGYCQNFGELASGVSINNTIYNVSGTGSNKINATPGALSFDGLSLGTFSPNSACAKITAAEIKTWKNNTGNTCNAALNWRVYLANTSPSGSFNTIALSTLSECNTGTTLYDDGIGTCAEGDQKWKDYNLNIDFTNALAVGNYILEVYFTYSGSDTSTSTCETTKYINNVSANYKATFTISDPTTNPTASATLLCEGTALTLSANPNGGASPYTFSWTGPNGYTASVENPVINNTTITNSGSYSVTITDACGISSGIQTTTPVTINPKPNATATNTTQTICSANPIATMVISGNIASTTFNWTRDNTLTVTGMASSGSGNISGNLTNTTNTAVTVTFTITPSTSSCTGTSITTTVLVNPTTIAGAVTTSLPNASPVVKIITVCHSASGSVYLSGQVGNVVRWESSINGGYSWTDIGNANTTVYNYTNLLVTTLFRAVIQSGTSCNLAYTTSSMINVIPNVKPSPVTASPATICEGESSILTSQSGYATSQYIEPGGDFGNSNPANWTVDGCGNCLSAGNSNTNPGPFQLSATNGGTYSGIKYKSSGKFAIANGNYNSVLETPIFNTLGLTTASLQFNQAYNLLSGAWAKVELSLDGGATYTIVLSPTPYNGPSTQQPYDPISTVTTLNLNNYLGLSNLRIRFNYHGTVGSSWAIDNILIPDLPVNLTTEWVDSTTGLVISNTASTTVSPSVTTTYAVISRLNGCTSFGPEGTTYITVTVKPKAIVTATPISICTGDIGTIPLTSNVSGTTFTWTVVQTNITGASAGSGNSISQTLTATGTSVGTAVYTITPIANGCTGVVKTVTATVSPKPVVSFSSTTICSGDTNIVPTAFNLSGISYSWTVVQTNVSGATAGSGTTIAQSLTATETVAGTAVYNITPYINGCAGAPKTVTITVNPKAKANIGTSQTICKGETATISITLAGKAPWNITYTDGTTATTVATNTNPYLISVVNPTSNKSYSVTALSDANCIAKPEDLTGIAVITVLNGTQGVWTGLVSNDWFDCLNWAGGLPTNTVNAVINSGVARMPEINPSNSSFAAAYSNIANAQDLIIANGASVSMATIGTSNLQISRNWKNSGSFNPGTGTVTFNGATSNQVQTVNLGIKTNENFYNLTTNATNGAKGINVADGFELTVSNLLFLSSGDIRLTGEAQLIQTGNNTNPTSGSGKIMIDQQGQKNSFNYNYWSSPVSSNNTNYTISAVLRDGTDVLTNPFTANAINFADDVYFADGAISNPIKISESWLYSYNSSTPNSNSDWDNYYQWNAIGSTTFLKVGEGFTMKGTGGAAAISAQQNYVFIGKPNSGNITLNIAPEDTYLIGNPYPSALDADEFIKDNLKDCTGCRASANVFNGALYFWDHFGLSNNHFLAEYEGGYATYTLMGGVAGVADDPLNVNNGLTGSKIPKRYIPVAQGFFIDAYTDPDLSGVEIPTTVSGGSIVFKNSQRAFMKESSGNAVFMKINPNSKPKITEENIDTRSKIRLGFDAATGAHRQLLIGTDKNASSQFDIGYDAQLFDLQKNDLFWKINNSPFVIQAVPNFNSDQIIPLGLVIENEGPVTLKIDALENIPSNTAIYLYDNTTGEYHNMRDNSFTIPLPSGEYNDRFSLRFSDKTLSIDEISSDAEIKLFYANNYKILIIQNKLTDTSVEKVMLFNLLGQMLSSWDTSTENQTKIQLPIKNTAAGIYIVKLKTSKGDFSKKIVVR